MGHLFTYTLRHFVNISPRWSRIRQKYTIDAPYRYRGQLSEDIEAKFNIFTEREWVKERGRAEGYPEREVVSESDVLPQLSP